MKIRLSKVAMVMAMSPPGGSTKHILLEIRDHTTCPIITENKELFQAYVKFVFKVRVGGAAIVGWYFSPTCRCAALTSRPHPSILAFFFCNLFLFVTFQ